GHCKDLNTTIFSRNQKIDLDPSRLYQVHYLFAAKGEELSSRWGHAMLRLVFCAPERMQVDEKCLNDVSHHYVISFRADIDDFELDNIKGLTGKYPSQMFVLNLDEVVKEYTQIELRDLKSLPLRLNEKEKEQFINKVLETYWSYRGRYYFLSNNCADETFSLLAGILGDKYQFAMQKFAFQDATLVMPGELYSFYLETGLAEPPSSNIAEQVSKGHLFESAQKKVKLAYSVISSDRSASTLKKYLNESQASERKVNFELMVSDSPQNQTKLASAYYVLESYFLIRKQSQMRKNLAQKIYEKDPEILNLYAEAKIQFSDTIENEILNLEYDGYGVPLARDQERFTRQNQKSNFSEDEFLSQIESVLPGDMAEVNAIRENLKLFIKKTIKTKQHNP
ncbi:MAG: DUF4105 domain-containing protein, partial [Bdellovibrionales bacterium]|nr:DUF4105 domain-containing protein [Bdellovibrionales bacterium]